MNLTQVSFYTRRLFKTSLILFIGFFIVRISVQVGIQIYKTANPEPPPPPTVSFGKLPKIVFPKQTIELPKFSYKLETKEGGLPELTNVSKVYFMPQKGANLLDPNRAKQQALKMGFKNEPQILNNNIYRWISQNQPTSLLEINIGNNNFNLKYDYANDPETQDRKYLPTTQQAAQETKTFLTNNNLLPESLQNGTAEFEYLSFDLPELKSVPSLSQANFVRVNLFKANLDELRLLPPNPKKSLVSFLFSGSRTPGKRVVEINYNYFPIEKEIFATYPLKSISKAWEEFQQEKAYIAHLGQNQSGKIIIRWVSLAYYDSPESQNYLQPIFVFQGDNDFFAYISAITPQWLE